MPEDRQREHIEKICEYLAKRDPSLARPKHGEPEEVSLVKLFRYLAGVAMMDPGRTLTQFEIAEQVFKKPPEKASFIRPLVPKLRERLRKYYDGQDGKSDTLVLTVPKYEYRVVFSERTVTESTSAIPNATHGAHAAAFWRLLVPMCYEQGQSKTYVEQQFWDWVDKSGRHPGELSEFLKEASRFRSPDRPTKQREFFDSLRDSWIPIEDMRSLAERFQIHQLMLDPLISEVIQSDSLLIDLKNGFFSPPPGAEQAGDQWRERAVYKIPDKRLAETDVAFVQLEIKAGGKSDTHEHPGDELILVLKGEIEFQLEHSGLAITLSQGDYVHFYAEQTHQVLAKTDARLFIIRLYQIEAQDTRQQMRREVEECLVSGKAMSQLSLAWVQQSISPRPHTGPAQVCDRLGLARFLRRLSSRVLPPNNLSSEVRQKMAAWEAAERETAAGDLEEIYHLYHTEVMLLKTYLYPASPNVVVVRENDMVSIDSQRGSVNYRVPPRNLACSDIAIAEVRLKPQAETPVNRHPGFELLIPLEGEATIYFEEGVDAVEVCTVSAALEHYAHYTSEKAHFVRNNGELSSRLLVIRFYRDGPPKPDERERSQPQ